MNRRVELVRQLAGTIVLRAGYLRDCVQPLLRCVLPAILTEKKMEKDSLSFYEPSIVPPVSIISIPLELGSDQRGLSEAPRHLHDQGFPRMLEAIGAEIVQRKEVLCPTSAPSVFSRAKSLDEIAAVADYSAEAVSRAIRSGSIPIALGGDHAISIGTIAGALNAVERLGVIWIDAHPDVNTAETTKTGNAHGFGAACALGIGDARFTSLANKHLRADDMLHIGLRNMDPGEVAFLRTHHTKYITMLDITERGLSKAFGAIDALTSRVDRVWVSMDMDSIDQAYAPGVGMPNTNGLTRREALALAQYIGARTRLAGFDVVEMLPANDAAGMTAKLAIELIAWFLGKEYSWYTEYMDSYRDTNVVSGAMSERKS